MGRLQGGPGETTARFSQGDGRCFQILPSVPNARLVTADKLTTGRDLRRLRRAVQEGYVNRILFVDDEPLEAMQAVAVPDWKAERRDRVS